MIMIIPKLIQYSKEINHSNQCNTYLKNENLKNILRFVYNGDRKNQSEIDDNNDKIIDKKKFRIKLTNN